MVFETREHTDSRHRHGDRNTLPTYWGQSNNRQKGIARNNDSFCSNK